MTFIQALLAGLASAINAEESKVIAESNRILREINEPRAIGNVWHWLEENTYLGERQTATPGRYSTAMVPYVREPLDCFGDRTITDLTLCFGTQTSKTTILMGGMAFRIVNDPMPSLWVMPNLDLGKSFSQNRWMPYVDDCPPLRAQKPTGRGARYLWKKTEQYFSKVTLKIVGSNSAANIASHPAGFVIMDETDKFEIETDREAGALQNAEERTKSFPYPLRVKASTPTTIHGEIWKEFLLGDQRYYHMPCPHCKEEITFQFPFLKWWDIEEDESKTDGEWDLAKIRRNAHYKCQLCSKKIFDRHKADMLTNGRWIPMNPNAQAGRRSYHLNSMYAPWKECLFGSIAVKWIQSRGSMSRRHAFINSTLAEPWDEERMFDDVPIFTQDYDPKKVTGKHRAPVMAVDVQEREFWVEVRAFSPTGESWMLWCGKLLTEQELVDKQKEFNVPGNCVGLDMGRWQNRVAQMIVRNDWRGLWGTDRQQFIHTLENGSKVARIFDKPRQRDPFMGTVYESEGNPGAWWAYWCNDPVKNELDALRFEEPCRYHVLSTIPKEYQRHMNAEILSTRVSKRTGRTEEYYKQIRRDNHLRDCALMAIVLAVMAGLIEDVEIASPNVRPPPPRQRGQLPGALDLAPIV